MIPDEFPSPDSPLWIGPTGSDEEPIGEVRFVRRFVVPFPPDFDPDTDPESLVGKQVEWLTIDGVGVWVAESVHIDKLLRRISVTVSDRSSSPERRPLDDDE